MFEKECPSAQHSRAKVQQLAHDERQGETVSTKSYIECSGEEAQLI